MKEGKLYSVGEVAGMTGVSIRTLHHYDEQGLLKPASRSESGYRLYGMDELLRLQQILVYRELEIPLHRIHELLDEAGPPPISILEAQRKALIDRNFRTRQLIRTLDKTLQELKKGTITMKAEELYAGLPKEVGSTYRNEAMEKYGEDKVKQSEDSLAALGRQGFDALQTEFRDCWDSLFLLRKEDPASEKVQKEIARHYALISQFWGRSEALAAEEYRSLAATYVADERFTSREGHAFPDFASFLEKAMNQFSANLDK